MRTHFLSKHCVPDSAPMLGPGGGDQRYHSAYCEQQHSGRMNLTYNFNDLFEKQSNKDAGTAGSTEPARASAIKPASVSSDGSAVLM